MTVQMFQKTCKELDRLAKNKWPDYKLKHWVCNSGFEDSDQIDKRWAEAFAFGCVFMSSRMFGKLWIGSVHISIRMICEWLKDYQTVSLLFSKTKKRDQKAAYVVLICATFLASTHQSSATSV